MLQGIKPASLGKVIDPQVKQFIEKCLVPASMRLPAIELLKDPFLSSENTKERSCNPLQFLNSIPKSMKLQTPEVLPMDIDHDNKKLSVSTCTKSSNETCHLSTLEFQRFNEKNEFRLKGQQTDDNSISLTLRISNLAGKYLSWTSLSLCTLKCNLNDVCVSYRSCEEHPFYVLS